MCCGACITLPITRRLKYHAPLAPHPRAHEPLYPMFCIQPFNFNRMRCNFGSKANITPSTRRSHPGACVREEGALRLPGRCIRPLLKMVMRHSRPITRSDLVPPSQCEHTTKHLMTGCRSAQHEFVRDNAGIARTTVARRTSPLQVGATTVHKIREYFARTSHLVVCGVKVMSGTAI